MTPPRPNVIINPERPRLRRFHENVAGLIPVSFSRDDAFFVMLGDHKSFDDGTLAQAVAECRVGTPYEWKGVLGPKHTRPMHEQNKLQRYGMTTLYQVDGHTVLGALLSSAGTSVLHTRHASRMMRTISEWEPQIDEPGFSRAADLANLAIRPGRPNGG